MSNEAIRWAIEEAPCPNATAADVLVRLAYRADRLGRGSWASIERLQLECWTGATAIRAGLRDLQAAGLIEKDGYSRAGTVNWRLRLDVKRAVPIAEELSEIVQRRRESDRDRQQKRRGPVTPDSGVTEIDFGGDVTPDSGVMSRRIPADVTPESEPEQSVNSQMNKRRGHAAPGPPATDDSASSVID